MKYGHYSSILALSLLAGCVTVPTGPSVMVLPGSGKDFTQFQYDDAVCRQWALQQTGTTTNKAATESAVTSAAVGTVVGAAAGAAIGAAAGDPAMGAAAGSGVGLFGGTAAGVDQAGGSQYEVQRRYDMSYIQCMYAKGHQVPVPGGFQQAPRGSGHNLEPPPVADIPRNVPPPPRGTPPPPPPGPVR
ncbi:MAG: glycine zipper family protein [Candidatus Binatia bacterium]